VNAVMNLRILAPESVSSERINGAHNVEVIAVCVHVLYPKIFNGFC
jgi:hypothetical protein